MGIEVPRNCNGDYEPQLIPKHERHFDGFDDVIISLYSQGMTVRETQEYLKELYNVDVSSTLISNVTNSLFEEVKAWQSRPLEVIYPIVYFDAIVTKVRHDGKVSNRAIYLALAITMERKKAVASELKNVYCAPSAQAVKMALDVFKNK